jgi:hypothetical protein
MADTRINALSTATSSASDDFVPIDGTTNGTRKLSAYSPSFGGNATVGGTLTVNGNVSVNSSSNAGLKALLTNTSAGTGAYVEYELSNNTDAAGVYVFGTGWTTSGRFIQASTLVDSSASGGLTIASTGTTPIRFWLSSEVARFSPTNGNLLIGGTTDISGSGGLKVFGTTASTSTSSGALVVGNGTSGGLGVGGDVSVAGRIRAQLSIASDGSVPSGLASAYQVDTDSATVRDILSFGNGSRAGLIRGYQDGGGVIDFRFGRYTASTFEEQMRLSGTTAASSSLTLYGTTASTSTSSGALVVSGGVGVAGAAFLGGNVTSAGTRGFVRYKSSNGSTASPVEDRIVGFSNTNDLLFEGGMYGVNSLTDNSAVWLRFKTLNTSGTAVTALTLDAAQKAEFASTIKTAAPSGGTAAEWKLGTVATVSPTSPNRTIEVDIGGTIYYIAAKTTNN